MCIWTAVQQAWTQVCHCLMTAAAGLSLSLSLKPRPSPLQPEMAPHRCYCSSAVIRPCWAQVQMAAAASVAGVAEDLLAEAAEVPTLAEAAAEVVVARSRATERPCS